MVHMVFHSRERGLQLNYCPPPLLEMALNVRALKREFEIRTWSRIIGENPYVAVLQITGGRAWGRSNMTARILGEDKGLQSVGVRFASPKAAREGALRTRYVGLSELFRGVPSAVVYGNDVGDVVRVLKRARQSIDGGMLVGGRFGDTIITARVWEEVLGSEGERAEWERLARVLGSPPGFVRVLDASSKGLYQALESGGGAAKLVRVLDRVGETETS